MLGAVCHDFGKPSTTAFLDGRIRSIGHEEAGVPPATAFLDRLNIHSIDGVDVAPEVLGIVAHHLKPGMWHKVRGEVGDGAFRRLAQKVNLELLARLAKADCTGRAGRSTARRWIGFSSARVRWASSISRRARLVLGRHLMPLGVAPGPAMGQLLQAHLRAAARWRGDDDRGRDRARAQDARDAGRTSNAQSTRQHCIHFERPRAARCQSPAERSRRPRRWLLASPVPMLPPLRTATIGLSSAIGRPNRCRMAATLAAPLGSTTIFASRARKRTASARLVVVDRDHLVDERPHVRERQVAGPHRQQAVGDARRAGRGSPARPAASERLIFAAPAGSTPMTRASGLNAFTAAATPASRPPPPTGT